MRRSEASSEGSESESDSEQDMAGLEAEVEQRTRPQSTGARRAVLPWTAAESAALVAAMQTHGTRWHNVHADAVARGVNPARTPLDLQKRYYRVRDNERRTAAAMAQQLAGPGAAASLPAVTRAPGARRQQVRWSRSESDALQALVAQLGEGNWRALRDAGVASNQILALRSPHDVRQRWQTLTKSKAPWSAAEQQLFVRLVARHGVGRWAQVAADAEAAAWPLARRWGGQLSDMWRLLAPRIQETGWWLNGQQQQQAREGISGPAQYAQPV